MEVLPHGAADGAWDSCIVVESSQTSLDRFLDEIRPHDRAALDRDNPAFFVDRDLAGLVSDDESPDAEVADQDIGARAKEKERDPMIPCKTNGCNQLIHGVNLHERIRRTANLKRCVLAERLVSANILVSDDRREGFGQCVKPVAKLRGGAGIEGTLNGSQNRKAEG